jgi:MscS family membrane protein
MSILQKEYIFAIIFLLLLFLVHFFIFKYPINYLRKISNKTKNKISNIIFNAIIIPLKLISISLAFYLSISLISFDDNIKTTLDKIFHSFVIFSIFYFLFRLSSNINNILISSSLVVNSKVEKSIFMLLEKSLRIFIIVLFFVITLQEWGYDIGAFLASIGLGGIAFAMAAKDTIANFFGSLVIISDKTYSVGDWIKMDEMEGVVEEIGIRSTKVRSFSNTLLIVPNSSVATQAIENFSKMEKRRIKLNISLIYETTNENIKLIKQDVLELLKNHTEIHQELILVNFDNFGDSGLNLLCYFFTTTTQWREYLDLREEMHFKIRDIIISYKSDFAYPSQTIYLNKEKL